MRSSSDVALPIQLRAQDIQIPLNLIIQIGQGLPHTGGTGTCYHVVANHVGNLAVNIRITNEYMRLMTRVQVWVPSATLGGRAVDLIDQLRDDALRILKPNMRRDFVDLAVGDALEDNNDSCACSEPESFHGVGGGACDDLVARGLFFVSREQLPYGVQGRERIEPSCDLFSFGGRLGNCDLRHALLAGFDQINFALPRLSSDLICLGNSILDNCSSRGPAQKQGKKESE